MTLRHIAVFGGDGDIGRAVRHALSGSALVSSFDIRYPVSGIKEDEVWCDVTKWRHCMTAVARCCAARGPITDIVYSVGVYFGQTWETLDEASMRSYWEINCSGCIGVIKAWLGICCPPQDTNGSVVIFSSAAARLAGLDIGYASSKAALESCVFTVARALMPKGLLVYGIAPGIIESRMASVVPQERYEKHARSNLLGRASKPHELAAIVELLLSGSAIALSGSVLDASAGVTLR